MIERCGTVKADGGDQSAHVAITGVKAMTSKGNGDCWVAQSLSSKQQSLQTGENIANTIGANDYKEPQAVGQNMQVRRLMPIEAERLQGFPDDWTRYGITRKGQVKEIADGPRYKMLGNAVTVNVAEWLGKRIINGVHN